MCEVKPLLQLTDLWNPAPWQEKAPADFLGILPGKVRAKESLPMSPLPQKSSFSKTKSHNLILGLSSDTACLASCCGPLLPLWFWRRWTHALSSVHKWQTGGWDLKPTRQFVSQTPEDRDNQCQGLLSIVKALLLRYPGSVWDPQTSSPALGLQLFQSKHVFYHKHTPTDCAISVNNFFSDNLLVCYKVN